LSTASPWLHKVEQTNQALQSWPRLIKAWPSFVRLNHALTGLAQQGLIMVSDDARALQRPAMVRKALQLSAVSSKAMQALGLGFSGLANF
jgi:hypothetical protein